MGTCSWISLIGMIEIRTEMLAALGVGVVGAFILVFSSNHMVLKQALIITASLLNSLTFTAGDLYLLILGVL